MTNPARVMVFLLCLAFGSRAAAQETNAILSSLKDLQQYFSNHLAQAKFDAAEWGVKVVSLETGQTLFEHQSQKLLSPASNSKLYTVAAALDRLGTGYQITTSVYAQSKPTAKGVIKGDLVVFGRGDPTINSRLHGGNLSKALEPLVSGLVAAGVKRITGDLVGDETFFVGPPYGSGWSWDDSQYYYGAEITALTIEDNTIAVSLTAATNASHSPRLQVVSPWHPAADEPVEPRKSHGDPFANYLVLSNRVTTTDQGSRLVSFYRPLGQNIVYVTGRMPVNSAVYKEDVTIPRPAAFFLTCLRQALEDHGIRVDGRNRVIGWLERGGSGPDYSAWIELGRRESLPLSEIAREVQKPSQNLYTDLLLAHLGEKTRRTDKNRGSTSEDLGIEELKAFLRDAGIGASEVMFEEGSGLSRNNLTTANATVRLLHYMDAHRYREAYINALPVAGVDGTLRNRMKGTEAAGKLQAKTGTLRWANSLSGFVKTKAGERLVFSLMLNRYASPDPQRSARMELDVLAVQLANFPVKSSRQEKAQTGAGGS